MSSTLPASLTSLEMMKESIDSFNDSRTKKDDKPSTFALVCEALKTLGSEDKGLSIVAIKEWIVGHYSEFDSASLSSEIKVSITKGLENGIFKRAKNSEESKGTNGYFMLTVNETWLDDDDEESDDEEIASVHAKAIAPNSHSKNGKKADDEALKFEREVNTLSRSSTLLISDSSLSLNNEISQIENMSLTMSSTPVNRRLVKMNPSERKFESGVLLAKKLNKMKSDSFKIKTTPISMTPVNKRKHLAKTPTSNRKTRHEFVVKAAYTPDISLNMLEKSSFRPEDSLNGSLIGTPAFINKSQIRAAASIDRSQIRTAASINRSQIRTAVSIDRSQIAPADFIRNMQSRAAAASINDLHKVTPDSTSKSRAADSATSTQISVEESILPAKNNVRSIRLVKSRTVIERKVKTSHAKNVLAKKNERPKAQVKILDLFKDNTKLNARQNIAKVGSDEVLESIDDDLKTTNKFTVATPVIRSTRVRGKKRPFTEEQEGLDMDPQMVKLPPGGKLVSAKPKKLERIGTKMRKKPTAPEVKDDDPKVSEREGEVLDMVNSTNQTQISQQKEVNGHKRGNGLLSDEPELKMENPRRNDAAKFKLFKEHLKIPKPRGRPKTTKSNAAQTTKLKDIGTSSSDPVSSISKPDLRKPNKENVLNTEPSPHDTAPTTVTKKPRLKVTSKPTVMTKSKTDSGLVVKKAVAKKGKPTTKAKMEMKTSEKVELEGTAKISEVRKKQRFLKKSSAKDAKSEDVPKVGA